MGKPTKLWFVVIVLVTGAALYGFIPRAVRVEFATVTSGPLQVFVNEDGKTRIRERYVVSTPIGGRSLRLQVHPGDAVEAGKTLLAIIYPAEPPMLDLRTRAEAEARVKASAAVRQQALAHLETARTANEFAGRESARAQTLYKTNVISRAELDSAEQKFRTAAEELRAAEFTVRIAEFEHEQARAALLHAQSYSSGDTFPSNYEIRSPVSGRVLRVLQESSTIVSPGATLLEVGNPCDLELEIDVLSTDAVKIKLGAPITVHHWGGDVPLHARVRLVEPSAFTKISALGVEEQRVNVIADLVGDTGRARLGDGFRFEAAIVTWETNNTPKIPLGALFRHGSDWAVFARLKNRATLRIIQIGERNDTEAQMLGGLEVGATVILHPSDKVHDGVTVGAR